MMSHELLRAFYENAGPYENAHGGQENARGGPYEKFLLNARPFATIVWGLELLVYGALSY